MKDQFGRKIVFPLTILSTALVVFNMIAIPMNARQIFIERTTLSSVEIIIFLGFISILFGNLIAVYESARQMLHSCESRLLYIIVSLCGFLCIVFLFGDKVMIDELGREYLPGGKLKGEWIMLFLFLALQLIYNIFILWLRLRSYPFGNSNKQKLRVRMNET